MQIVLAMDVFPFSLLRLLTLVIQLQNNYSCSTWNITLVQWSNLNSPRKTDFPQLRRTTFRGLERDSAAKNHFAGPFLRLRGRGLFFRTDVTVKAWPGWPKASAHGGALSLGARKWLDVLAFH
jgi:hypothetical protein